MFCIVVISIRFGSNGGADDGIKKTVMVICLFVCMCNAGCGVSLSFCAVALPAVPAMPAMPAMPAGILPTGNYCLPVHALSSRVTTVRALCHYGKYSGN